MADPYNLQRFIDAQESIFGVALAELKAGFRQSHWMWFVFPQLAGLGHSPTAQYFALSSLAEARAYLGHPVLGPRLRQSVEALLPWAGRRTARQILGEIDSLKLRSSLTLFDAIEPNSLFDRGVECFFDGDGDERTLALLNSAR